MRIVIAAALIAAFSVISVPATAAEFTLVTGIDATLYPGTNRTVFPSPGPGFPATFRDGDRLAGTADVGVTVSYVGLGTPMYPPNHIGAVSFLFRRGSIPAGGANRVPIMGIDFLGGPLLDLDGDAAAPRSLVPVPAQTPVEIPGRLSHVTLDIDLQNLTVTLENFDATGTNEGGPNIQPEIATTLTTLAGTTPDGSQTGPINPGVDTRIGTLTSHPLSGVYQIQNLGFELWYDSIDPGSSSADELGTLQHLGTFRGWLVRRNCATGQFPTLTGQGLGSTLWPLVNAAHVGQTYNTAVTLFGPTATITNGNASDNFTAPNNGGVALVGGDLGAYFDNVIVPHLDPQTRAFVYLEAAGAGINNSGDPVFSDTIGYDVVIVAATAQAVPGLPGDLDENGVVNLLDADLFVTVLLDPDSQPDCLKQAADLNADGEADGLDIAELLSLLL